MKQIPAGYDEIFGETIVQKGDKFLSAANEWTKCGSSIGRTVIKKNRRIIRPNIPIEEIEKNELKELGINIPFGYEINTNDSSIAKRGDYYINGNNKGLNTVNTFRDKTVKTLRQEFNCYLLKKKDLTPAEMAKEFINKNIPGASPETLKKYESVFSREDNFGL